VSAISVIRAIRVIKVGYSGHEDQFGHKIWLVGLLRLFEPLRLFRLLELFGSSRLFKLLYGCLLGLSALLR
jgi:hypothetical protein